VLVGINGINGLLAGAGACAQQNNADAMVDFAKLPVPGINNKQASIDNAIAYCKCPCPRRFSAKRLLVTLN
jgi:hypothetical protein